MICPVCKEEMPLLSRICPTCHHVFDEDDERMSPKELADELDATLYNIKSLPQPSFGRSMGQFAVYVLPLLTLCLLFAAVISEAGIFWLAAILFALLSIVVIVMKMLGRIGNSRADKLFAQYKIEAEQLSSLARRDFGRSSEITKLVGDIAERIEAVENARKSASRRNLIVWSVITLVVVLLAAQGLRSVSSAVEEADQVSWREHVEVYRRTGGDDYDSTTRTTLIGEILAAGEVAEAERFFRDCCMGRMGDYDCAAAIVGYYQRTGAAEAARTFVKGADLRYSSDETKLKKLLTD